jgi:hypothetical protein
MSESRRLADGGLNVMVGDLLLWHGSKPGPHWTLVDGTDQPEYWWWIATESYVEYHPKMAIVPAGGTEHDLLVPGGPVPAVSERRNPPASANEMRVLAAVQRAKDADRQTDLEHQVDIEVHRRALELRAAVIIAALGVVLAIVLAIWGRG